MEKHKHFPLFLNIKNKKVVVIGGGKIALRRIKTLLKFKMQIKVVSPKVEDEIKNFAEKGLLCWTEKEYEKSDIHGYFIAIAATDKRDVNHAVGVDAKALDILASVADCKDECDFYFPAIIEDDKTVIAVVGNGNDHRAVAEVAKKIREIL